MVGETLGSYRIASLLGEGGMGRVYRAEHVLIGRPAAIKVLLPEFSSRAEVVERFFNEAKALATLRHPGLVDVLDFGQHTDGSAYLVMELLEGEALSARLERDGRLPLHEALEVARQAAAALGAAHRKAIVHRDLKPENIFLTSDPEFPERLRVKILDFGIAKLSGEAAGAVKTRTDLVMGTPRYMSPEQCRGGGEIDHRADIYALGCVLFHLLCGRPPFDDENSGELIAAHLMKEPPSARTFVKTPPAVEGLVLRALAKKPEDRFAEMAALAEALERTQASLGATIVEYAAPPRGRAAPGLRAATTLSGSAVVVARRAPATRGVGTRRRAFAIGLGAGAAAAIVLGGVAVLRASVARPWATAAFSARPAAASLRPPVVSEVPLVQPLPHRAVAPPPAPAAKAATPPPTLHLLAMPRVAASHADVGQHHHRHRPAYAAPAPSAMPVGQGYLRLGSKPWTRITIDGKDTGLTTPQIHLAVDAGTHWVTLTNPSSGLSQTFSVTVAPGQTETIIKDLWTASEER